MKRFLNIFIVAFLGLAFIRIFIENALDKIELSDIDWFYFMVRVVISSTIFSFTVLYFLLPQKKRSDDIYNGVTVPKKKDFIFWLSKVIQTILVWTAFVIEFGFFYNNIWHNIIYIFVMGLLVGTTNYFTYPINNSRRFSNKPEKDSVR